MCRRSREIGSKSPTTVALAVAGVFFSINSGLLYAATLWFDQVVVAKDYIGPIKKPVR